ncbi:EAL and HDOD domain-containing protein [Clostridium vincentii]|uniref:EAL domain protein n=1 Tax=Clostridium vincentii TaxID=52704 RepID=A0A2T0BCS5_9CLOT|nr:HDOD domain-containing protein [Clostridium vincentii]PRR81700.1 EAL domain protein [Clostridium vincentii]
MMQQEILEDVEPTDEIINACKELKEKGYILALDDFVFHSKYEELIKLADIIKIDFSITKGEERKNIVQELNCNNRIKFLAEKVETIKEYNEALNYGYEYFQGYYFSKPKILSSKGINTNKYIALKILDKINKNEVDFDEIESLILKDVGLSYKLLRLINSASIGLKNEISSIKYALALLGKKEIVKWLYVVLLNELKQNSSKELVSLGLLRAKFCEKLCINSKIRDKGFMAYMTGLFSLMDAILGAPIDNIVKELYLPDEVKDALISKNNSLNDILSLVISYEKGDWNRVLDFAKELSIKPDIIVKNYFDSLEWVRTIA